MDGELGRIRDARGKGLVPPAFLLDTAITQMEASLKTAREGGGLVEQPFPIAYDYFMLEPQIRLIN
jgi:hypothetical protein